MFAADKEACMRKGWLFSLVLVPMTLLLAGCPELANGPTGVTVSGTMTGANLGITGPVTVTVSKSGSSVSTQVTLPVSETGPYSISNVPVGDYTFVAVFDCNWSFALSQYYSINGGAQVLCDSDVVTGSRIGPYTHTVTFSSVPIPDAETIDVDLGNMS